MANLAIIPARGGSKRIPRKNIKDFLGKPIMAYSIEAALKSNLFEEVMVSTDDEEIAEIAIKYGAKVPFLRSELSSNDYATTFQVIDEVITIYKKLNKTFDFICCLYPCAPFITNTKLQLTFQKLIEGNFDSVFPVIPYGHPIQRALQAENSGKINFFNPEYSQVRSQDLEPTYHDAGQFYWMRTEICLNQKKILTHNSGYIILTELEAQDIDTETDWKLAELKHQIINHDQKINF